MNHLFTYISATKSDTTSTFVTEHRVTDTSYSDEDLEVCGKESIFSFANGVQLKKTEEFDDIQDSELVCPECWISYEVIAQPVNLQVTPRKKILNRAC
ncbi:hypothetical protein M9194_04705 [Vibrio sp. S4M6]|uniref:hypothetical protein n=1 Tax=Vibrio sinus TaxID=2946865 RepID=UPI00202A7331|nr:hypothetical protein [Vibrio sinus]MCL9780737.1 hypothetical protein [Vibrio sinus]